MRKDSDEYSLPILLVYFLVLADSYVISVFHLLKILDIQSGQISFPNILFFLKYVEFKYLVSAVILMNLIIPLWTVRNINSRLLRVSNFILFFVTKGIIFSHHQFAHYYWPMMWILLILCIPSSWGHPSRQLFVSGYNYKPESEEFKLKVYKSAMLAGLSIYFFSGFWKLVKLISDGTIFDVEYGSKTVAYYLITRGKMSLLGDFAVQHPLLVYVSFLVIVGLQILSPLVVFSKKFLNFYILFIICFHTLNILVLQVNYILAGLISLILLAFVPKSFFKK